MIDETSAALRLVISQDSKPFWDACGQGYLALPTCGKCGQAHMPPGPVCPFCLSDEIAWVRASGRGRLSSWVVYHKSFAKTFADRTPYVAALVELEEGPRLTTTVRGMAPSELVLGLRLTVAFEDADRRLAIPVFHPAEEHSS